MFFEFSDFLNFSEFSMHSAVTVYLMFPKEGLDSERLPPTPKNIMSEAEERQKRQEEEEIRGCMTKEQSTKLALNPG